MRFLLRWACRVLAVGLIGLVLAAPYFAPVEQPEHTSQRILWIFANDSTMKQVAIACAMGLLLTAQFFFRKKKVPASKVENRVPDEVKPPPPPPRRE